MRTKEVKTPCCHHTVDAITDLLGDSSPSIGDICVCIYCGTPLILDNVAEHKMHVAKNDEIPGNCQQQIAKIQHALRVTKKNRPL